MVDIKIRSRFNWLELKASIWNAEVPLTKRRYLIYVQKKEGWSEGVAKPNAILLPKIDEDLFNCLS